MTGGPHRLRVSIVTLAVLILVGVAAVLSALFGLLYFADAVSRGRTSLAAQGTSLASELAGILALPLWNYDLDQVGRILESAASQEEVAGIYVRASDDAFRVVGRARSPSGAVGAAAEEPTGQQVAAEQLSVEERSIVIEGTELARLTLYLTPRPALTALSRTMRTYFAAALVLVVALSTCQFLLLWFLVLKPIREVQRYAFAMTEGRGTSLRPADIALPGGILTGEIGSLGQAVEEMVRRLEHRYAELAASEARATASETRYRSIFENSPVPLWEEDISELRRALRDLTARGVTDIGRHIDENPGFLDAALKRYRVIDVNQAALRLCGAQAKEQLLGSLSLAPDADSVASFRGEVIAIAEGRSWYEATGLVRTLRGELLPVLVHSRIPSEHDPGAGLLVNVVDLTKLREAEAAKGRLEEQLRHAQKIDSVGRLAGGIAHDLNNMLAPILGYSEMLLAGLPPGDTRSDDLRQVIAAAERARDLTRRLLAVGRKQTLALAPTDLRAVLDGLQRLLHRTLREDIRIRLIAQDTLPRVRADAAQIEQVLLNLALNAQDAMPTGGVLTLELRDAPPGIGGCEDHQGLGPGRYLLLLVRDTGVGMSPEVLGHLFEPFFTTKEKGKGTGLGLSTAHGIVLQHGGSIRATSAPGVGSQFEILLPVDATDAPGTGERAGSDRPVPAAPARALNGSETVLVVEDTAAVRDLVQNMLQRQGYRVLAAADAAEARSIVLTDPSAVDLLLTDVVMPGTDGRTLYESLVMQRPKLKVLYMSGYTDDIVGRHGVLENGTELIQKPFTTGQLCARLRGILDRRQAEAPAAGVPARPGSPSSVRTTGACPRGASPSAGTGPGSG